MKGRYIFALLIAVSGLVMAVQAGGTANLNRFQPAADVDLAEIDMRVTDFLRELINNRADDAVDGLLDGSPLERDDRKLTQLKSQIQEAEQRYGKFLRHEKLQSERIGESMIRSVHVLHCRRYPIIWRMTFYRSNPAGDWVLVSLRYDTNYDSLPTAQPQRVLPL